MFEPGNQHGKKGGRPRKSLEQIAFEFKCREYLDKYGIAQIVEMARSNIKQDRKWALEILMDRGFGKAVQSLDVESRQENPHSSPIELAGQIDGIIPIAAITGPGCDSGSGKDAGAGTPPVVQPESGPEAVH